MRNFLRALASEEIKHRRTLTRRLLVLGPCSLVACYAMVGLFLGRATTWQLFIGAIFNWWAVLWIPLGTALLCALSSSTETKACSWVALRARPISPATLYGAKLAVLSLHTLASAALVVPITAISGMALIGTPVPLTTLIALVILTWLAALPLLAIGLWTSVGVGFWGSVVLGIVGLFAGVLTAETGSWPFVPWAWPVRVSLPLSGVHANGISLRPDDPMDSLAVLPPVITVSLAVAAALAIAGSLWFSRREVK